MVVKIKNIYPLQVIPFCELMPRTGHIQYYCITPQSFSQPGAADLPSQSICRENCKRSFLCIKVLGREDTLKCFSASRTAFAVDLQFGQCTYRLDMCRR